MKIEQIKLDKGTNVFPVGFQNFHCTTVQKTVDVLTGADLTGCVFRFDVRNAPNTKRAFNAGVRRCEKIAGELGVTLTDPETFQVDGHDFEGQFQMTVES